MAKYVWEVPEGEYPVVAKLIMRVAKASRDGDVGLAAELTDRLKSFPAYPVEMNPWDTVTVVIAKPKTWVGKGVN